mmetsp:Transcript_779/g.1649  ORF Transcript_779/g.1649 Transcript_779/m.1649 type:complete len:204 (-) Transcript_779:1198-1809(-)
MDCHAHYCRLHRFLFYSLPRCLETLVFPPPRRSVHALSPRCRCVRHSPLQSAFRRWSSIPRSQCEALRPRIHRSCSCYNGPCRRVVFRLLLAAAAAVWPCGRRVSCPGRAVPIAPSPIARLLAWLHLVCTPRNAALLPRGLDPQRPRLRRCRRHHHRHRRQRTGRPIGSVPPSSGPTGRTGLGGASFRGSRREISGPQRSSAG